MSEWFTSSAVTVSRASLKAARSSLVMTNGFSIETSPVARTRTSRNRPMALSGGAGFQSTQPIVGSPGFGGKTSMARTFFSDILTSAVTSMAKRR